MNDEQIKTFKEEYALAVAKRDADRKNQIYDDDDDDEDNDVEMQSEEEEDDDDDDKDNDVEMKSEEEEEDREPMSFTLPFVGRAGLSVACTATGSIQVFYQTGRLKDKFITSVNNIDVGKCSSTDTFAALVRSVIDRPYTLSFSTWDPNGSTPPASQTEAQ